MWSMALFFCSASLLALAAATSRTITRDVCIIGGGSSGTYTAIQLQRHNYSIALVEKQAQLGGNVNTYTDPASGQTFDNGVVVFGNTTVVRDYFGSLNISLKPLSSASGDTKFVNFQTGTLVNNNPFDAGNVSAALELYLEQLNRYPYLINGFNLPSVIPEDFLLTWGDFIKKYKLQALAYVINTYNQGVGYSLDLPTLYMFKYLNQGEVASILNGFWTTKNNDNQQLYDAALQSLNPNVFLNSDVVSVKRTANGVRVVTNSSAGLLTIQAKELVIAIRPTLAAVQPWLDLTSNEKSLLAQFRNSNYWCGLVSNSGLPSNLTVDNADPSRPYDIPQSPSLYSIGATALSQGLKSVYYNSQTSMTDAAVQNKIVSILAKVRTALGYGSTTPQFVYWHAHVPFFLTVSVDAIKGGFYTRLEALQGQQRTHWTGAAWQTEDSSTIWNFTQAVILPRLLTALQH